jgi:hypothetical protein
MSVDFLWGLGLSLGFSAVLGAVLTLRLIRRLNENGFGP